MEEKKNEKKKIKLSLKMAILLGIIFIIIMVGFILMMINITKRKLVNEVLVSTNSEGYQKIEGDTSYRRMNNKTWGGEYYKDILHCSNFSSIMKIVDYKGYEETIKSINSISDEKLKKYYMNKNCNYIILAASDQLFSYNMEIIDCSEENGKAIIYGHEERYSKKGSGYLVVIPTNLPIDTNIEYIQCNTQKEIKGGVNLNVTIDKPIIYLYPTEETDVSVKLLKSENLTCSYPKYQGGWNVIAEPNGDLKDLTTNRNLYSLYYESKSDINFKVENEGFVIKGKDSAKFLEEKLAILGLNEKEAEEFIVYWLPRLEANKYNYIRFATLDEINENMPLEINPNPDSIIRIMMTFKGLDNPIDVKEQELVTPERNGFVAVEWGGTEIK